MKKDYQNWLSEKLLILKKIKLREIVYIYNSRVDFVDAWLSLLTILTGLVLIITDSIEKQTIYNGLLNVGLSSNMFGSFSIFVGGINITRVFLPFKISVYYSSVMKTMPLSIFLFLFFTIVGNPPLPIGTIFYLMVALLSFDNLLRTK